MSVERVEGHPLSVVACIDCGRRLTTIGAYADSEALFAYLCPECAGNRTMTQEIERDPQNPRYGLFKNQTGRSER